MANIYSAFEKVFDNNARIRVYYSYSQNQNANTTTVSGTAYYEAETADGAVSAYSLKIRVILGGQTFYLETAEQSIPYYGNGGRYVGSFSKTFNHNSDGTISGISIQGFGTNINEYTNVATIYPPNFSRGVNIKSFDIISKSMTGFTLSYSVDGNIDWIQHRVNGGNWVNDTNVTGLNPNTSYSLQIRVKRTDNQVWTESWIIQGTTYDYPKVTEADNFNDEQNPQFLFTNPAGSTLNVRLEFGGTAIHRNNIPNTGNYRFVFTQAEKELLLSKCTTSNTLAVRYVIPSKINSENENIWSFLDRTMTIINANPIFNNFTYTDINPITVDYTGDNKKLVSGYSNVKATISTANKATALKGASISKYTFKCGTKQQDGTYSSSAAVDITLNRVDNSTLEVYAVDSRGNSTKKEILASSFLDYFNINILAGKTVRGNGGIGTAITLDFNGSVWNKTFGNITNNITSAIYKFKKTTEIEWTIGTTNIVPNLSENSYSKSVSIAGDLGADGFDNRYSYNVQVVITDKLSTAVANITLQSGKPQLAFGVGEGISIGNFYNNSKGGDLQMFGENIVDIVEIIEEKIVTDTYTAIKYKDGRMEITQKVKFTNVNKTRLWQNLYITNSPISIPNFPVPFKKLHACTFNYYTIYSSWLMPNDPPSLNSAGSFYAVSPESLVIASIEIHVIAHGTWK